MRYIDEYRDRKAAQGYAALIERTATRPWTVMEICGGQTHTIVKYGIESLLPPTISIVHGPGCPVCVTPLAMIDRAIAIASQPDVILVSYGDMLRVPGSATDLLAMKARSGNVRMIYSPLDALALARAHRDKRIVFFAVGFETTAPANAMAVWQACREGLTNFSMLSSHFLVPPAIEAILSSPENSIQALLAAGHVCTVMGLSEYDALAAKYHLPVVVTGFEPVDILQGVAMAIAQLENGRHEVENQYARAVRSDGNPAARQLMDDVFEVTDRTWRGIGTIPRSGLRLRETYAAYDAERLFAVESIATEESTDCIAGAIMQGRNKPHNCPAFGSRCTPEHPLGAPMVSSEGACAAYWQYGRMESSSKYQDRKIASEGVPSGQDSQIRTKTARVSRTKP